MIPRVIHYCWFGPNPFPPKVRKCLESWKKHLSNYEIKRWDESNSPLDIPFVKKAYEEGLWAFVSDYVRFWVLFKEGGIYLDTDMLVLRDLDPLLVNKCFFGCETPDTVSCGIIGAVANHPVLGRIKGIYEKIDFERILITRLTTSVFREVGFKASTEVQTCAHVTLFPIEYFYSLPFQEKGKPVEWFLGRKSFAVHLWDTSWHTEWQHIKRGNQAKALWLVYQKIKINPLLGLRYYAKLIYYFLGLFRLRIFLRSINLEICHYLINQKRLKAILVDQGRIPLEGRKYLAQKRVNSIDDQSFLANISGLFFYLNLREHNSQRIFFNLFDAGTVAVFKKVQPDSIVIDVGANIGFYTLNFAMRNVKSGRVIAFEPHQSNFQMLERNVKENNFHHITLINKGLGKTAGQVSLENFGIENNGMIRVTKCKEGADLINLVTLDEFMLQSDLKRMDLVKVDIEGYEMNFLLGAKRTLSAMKPILFLELSDNHLKYFGSSAIEVVKFLESLEYDIRKAEDGTVITQHSYLRDCFFDILCEPK